MAFGWSRDSGRGKPSNRLSGWFFEKAGVVGRAQILMSFCAALWPIFLLMSRIASAFARARAQNRAAFIAYLCAGDPDFDTSLAACRALLQAGVDVLEIGVPFSDPLADGLTNQLAAQRALEGGMTAKRVFELTRRIRDEFPTVPI